MVEAIDWSWQHLDENGVQVFRRGKPITCKGGSLLTLQAEEQRRESKNRGKRSYESTRYVPREGEEDVEESNLMQVSASSFGRPWFEHCCTWRLPLHSPFYAERHQEPEISPQHHADTLFWHLTTQCSLHHHQRFLLWHFVDKAEGKARAAMIVPDPGQTFTRQVICQQKHGGYDSQLS